MNKYQKALDKLCGYAMECEYDYDYDDNMIIEYVELNEEDLKQLREPLQELVEKATSKKVKVKTLYVEYQEPETFVVCPICNDEFYYDDCDEFNYCPHCGQALDWSEEQ